jgi:hypothetical protein
MPRLIDADKVVFHYEGLSKIAPNDFAGIAEYFANQIKNAPTVDAVEIVRCMDCKYRKLSYDRYDVPYITCALSDYPSNGFFHKAWFGYCNYGEREENDLY